MCCATKVDKSMQNPRFDVADLPGRRQGSSHNEAKNETTPLAHKPLYPKGIASQIWPNTVLINSPAGDTGTSPILTPATASNHTQVIQQPKPQPSSTTSPYEHHIHTRPAAPRARPQPPAHRADRYSPWLLAAVAGDRVQTGSHTAWSCRAYQAVVHVLSCPV